MKKKSITVWIIVGVLVVLSILYYNKQTTVSIPQNPSPAIKGPTTPPPSNAYQR